MPANIRSRMFRDKYIVINPKGWAGLGEVEPMAKALTWGGR